MTRWDPSEELVQSREWSPETQADALEYLLGFLHGQAQQGSASAARAYEECIIFADTRELLRQL